ncbi:hypothetical protein, partial [Corynebacterium diphtheriae]
ALLRVGVGTVHNGILQDSVRIPVMAVLDLMDDEMIFEWSYRLRTDDRTDATELYALVRGYLDHAFPT